MSDRYGRRMIPNTVYLLRTGEWVGCESGKALKEYTVSPWYEQAFYFATEEEAKRALYEAVMGEGPP